MKYQFNKNCSNPQKGDVVSYDADLGENIGKMRNLHIFLSDGKTLCCNLMFSVLSTQPKAIPINADVYRRSDK